MSNVVDERGVFCGSVHTEAVDAARAIVGCPTCRARAGDWCTSLGFTVTSVHEQRLRIIVVQRGEA
jgi:hypothetical protein